MLRFVNQMRVDLVDWAVHMWAGAKLLAADVRVSSKILRRVLSGKAITRRERKFIVQKGVDLARLVPFSLFLTIPLAELALLLALLFFPNMLLSKFQARLELAKYLRTVVKERRNKSSARTTQTKSASETPMTKLRSRLAAIKKDDIQIMWEGGVGSLADQEVHKACKDRGIREEI